MDDRLVKACDEALFEACRRDLFSTDIDSATVEFDDAVRRFCRAVNRESAIAQRERVLDIAAIALLVAAEMLHGPTLATSACRDDPPSGYGVTQIPEPMLEHGRWRYWTRGLGCSGVVDTREEALELCWRHFNVVVSGWLENRPEYAEPLCAACGWPKDRSEPPTGGEPPIVRGALDAQRDAELRMLAVLHAAPGLTNMSAQQVLDLIAGSTRPPATPEASETVSPGPPRVDVLPPGVPDVT